MIVLGLTGSIGMGKSTVARMFADAGAPAFDSDAAVHALYCGPVVDAIEAAFPGTTISHGVDRTKLAAVVLDDPKKMRRLEEIVHPLVRAAQDRFLERCSCEGRPLVVLDIPLLFETGGHPAIAMIAVASARPDVQRQRVLIRPGMNPERLAAILGRQIPDAEKRTRAHFVIDTSGDKATTRAGVETILRALAGRA